MKNKALLLIPIAFLMAGCASDPSLARIEFLHCERIDPIPPCPNPDPNSSLPPININVTPTNIVVAPPNICANKGDVLEFDVNGPASGPHQITLGSVTVLPKDIANTWLWGTNYPEIDEIKIEVPSFVSGETDYDYVIVTASGLCLDPRLHVR